MVTSIRHLEHPEIPYLNTSSLEIEIENEPGAQFFIFKCGFFTFKGFLLTPDFGRSVSRAASPYSSSCVSPRSPRSPMVIFYYSHFRSVSTSWNTCDLCPSVRPWAAKISSINHHRTTANPSNHTFSESCCHPPSTDGVNTEMPELVYMSRYAF